MGANNSKTRSDEVQPRASTMASNTKGLEEAARWEEAKEEEKLEDGGSSNNNEDESQGYLQKPVTLLELGEETMAQAMLIFLLADLRILSARGMIRTKFEHLSLDSDRSPRLTSQDFAGFYNYDGQTSDNGQSDESTQGVKANHIMAVLLLEILSEAEDTSQDRPALLQTLENEVEGNAASRFRKDVRAANGMPTLLHCYNTMVSDDICSSIPRVSREKFPLNEDLPDDHPNNTQPQAKAEQDSSLVSSSLKTPHFIPVISSPKKSEYYKFSGISDREDSDSTSDSSGPRLTVRERMATIVPNRLKKDLLPLPETEREQEKINGMATVQQQMLNFAQGESSEYDVVDVVEDKTTNQETAVVEAEHNSVAAADKNHSQTTESNNRVSLPSTAGSDPAGSVPSEKSETKSSSPNLPKYHNSETIRTLMSQAIDQRDWDRLSFIKDFFRPGTVSRTLAESKSEMVWLSDWHEKYECTYAISVDREKGKVLLAFRGAYTSADWNHILDFYDTGTSNPVMEDYPDRPNNIRLHAGFYKYLFRVRKDTGTTKYDEIAAKLSHYCDMASNNGQNLVRITVTGHSLGSALATVFSLYASTEDRFTDNDRAIECVTFGAPCIGNWRFAGAVKHQEDTGRLRIAKFHVKGDVTVHLPPTFWRTSTKGAQYFHSGIDIMLPYIRNRIFHHILGGQPKPKVTYNDPDTQSYWYSLWRQLYDFYLWNMPIRFWRFALFHTLVEHRKRIALVNKEKSDAEIHEDPDSALMTKFSLKELYDIRSELATKKARKKLIKRMKQNNTS